MLRLKGFTAGEESSTRQERLGKDCHFTPSIIHRRVVNLSSLRVFQYLFVLPCQQALSLLEVSTPSHPTVFHTHHLGPYAALAFCHLAAAYIQKNSHFPKAK